MIRSSVRRVQGYGSRNVRVSRPVVSGRPGRPSGVGAAISNALGRIPGGPQPLTPAQAATAAATGVTPFDSQAPAPATPAAKPPPITSPTYGAPVEDSTYTQGVALNERDRATGTARITGHQNQLGMDYGINFTRNPDGSLGDYSIDPNVDTTNPFSMAAELRRAYANRQRFNTNSMAAQGQLYSGALQNAQDQAGFENQRGIDSLLKGFASAYGNDYAALQDLNSGTDRANLDEFGSLITRQPPPGPDLPAAAGAPGGTIYNSQNAPTPAPSQFSSVQLASGWHLLYDASGKPVRFISPQEWAAMGGGA